MKLAKLYFILFVSFFFTYSLSQNYNIDSLKREITLSSLADTNLVNNLNSLAFSYYSTDVNKTEELLNRAQRIADSLNYTKGKARAIFIRGIAFTVQAEYGRAIIYFDSASILYELIGDKLGLSATYNGLGIVNYYKGDLRLSIEYYKKAIEIEKELGGEGIKTGYLNIGNSYGELGEYDEAVKYYEEALQIYIDNNDSVGMSGCYNNIGTLYNDQGNYPLALKYYNKSLTINKDLGDSLEMAKSFNNIGIIYKDRNDFDNAINYYKKSLSISKSNNNQKAIAQTTMNIGIVYTNKKDYQKAIPILKEALIIFKKIHNKKLTSSCLNNLGDAYLELKEYNTALNYYTEAKIINEEIGFQLSECNSLLGIATVFTKQGNYNDALGYALRSKKISEDLGLLTFQRDVYYLLSEIYNHNKNYKKAFESHKYFKVLSDSIFNKENIEKLAQIEYENKYQQELKNASNRELKLTEKVKITSSDLQKSQRNLLYGIITFLLVALVLGGIIFYLRIRNIRSENKNIMIEQKLLRSQMTPHFIFNALSVLQGIILNREDKKAISYLSKFSKLLRIILENSRDKWVILNKELEALENYIELQNIEVKSPYRYHIFVESSIDRDLFKIPPMLIQPFVENAIEHGFQNKIINKEITIALTYNINNELICTITDNGVGIKSQKNIEHNHKKSLSTTITSERLDILSKESKIKGSIKIEDREKYNEKGTIVTLIIPHKTDVI